MKGFRKFLRDLFRPAPPAAPPSPPPPAKVELRGAKLSKPPQPLRKAIEKRTLTVRGRELEFHVRTVRINGKDHEFFSRKVKNKRKIRGASEGESVSVDQDGVEWHDPAEFDHQDLRKSGELAAVTLAAIRHYADPIVPPHLIFRRWSDGLYMVVVFDSARY